MMARLGPGTRTSMAEAKRRDWASLDPEQRAARIAAIKEGARLAWQARRLAGETKAQQAPKPRKPSGRRPAIEGIPPEYHEMFNDLQHSKGIKAAEAARIVREHIEVVRRRERERESA